MFYSNTILVATCFMCVVWQATGKPEMNEDFMHHLIHMITKPKFDECLNEAGLTKEDLHQRVGNKGELSDKEICLLKCLVTATGTFNADGTLNMEKAKMAVLPKYQTPEVMSCLQNAEATITCEDMKKIVNCFHKD